jgi:hypothetical protein
MALTVFTSTPEPIAIVAKVCLRSWNLGGSPWEPTSLATLTNALHSCPSAIGLFQAPVTALPTTKSPSSQSRPIASRSPCIARALASSTRASSSP